MKKGIVWLPIAIGVIFLVQILIFSTAFTRITIFARETVDSNIVFEGDELETYVRSIENSIQVSTAQAIYNFFLAHKNQIWQEYGAKNIPDYKSEIQGSSQIYYNAFLSQHENSKGNEKEPKIEFEKSEGATSATFNDNYVAMKLPELILKKIAFGNTQYTRKFVPGSRLDTVFEKMMKTITSVIQTDQVGTYVLAGVGKPSKDQCAVDYSETRLSTTVRRDLHSYIDEDVIEKVGTDGFGPQNYFDEGVADVQKNSQTQTTGWLEYCDLGKTEPKGCFCDDPCPSPSKDYPRINEPSPEELYGTYTHGVSYDDAKKKIVDYSRQRLICLEAELDSASQEYTVAFDGDKKNPGIGDFKIETKSDIQSSCSLENLGELCRGKIIRTCGECPTPGGGSRPKHEWECPIVQKKTCEYSHLAAGSAEVRFQEDGFVYGFWSVENSKVVADNIKLIFKIISGNSDLI